MTDDWSDWIEHAGGPCPVLDETRVIPGYRADANPAKGVRMEGEWSASFLDWSHDGADDDIIRYRVRSELPA